MTDVVGPGGALHGTAVFDEEARVVSIGEEQGGAWSALLLAPDIARAAKPMQFVQVKVGENADPFLRRPFGISHICREAGLIGITWTVVGKGTARMTSWEVDDRVSVLGPLGNGFEPPRGRAVWLIAGGTGLAPLHPLAQACRDLGSNVTLFYGARSGDLLMDTSRFADVGCEVHICTEDGSEGTRGFVTAALERALEALASSGGDVEDGCSARARYQNETQVQIRRGTGHAPLAVACGPTPMLQASKSLLAGTRIDLFLSLEGRMACGTGLCRGCAVRAAPPREGYLHVCTDGPVFAAGDVLLGG